MPSTFQDSTKAPLAGCVSAWLRVEMPDAYGVLCVDGELIDTKGAVRQLQSPPLPPGKTYTLQVRVVVKIGDNLLIEDKQVSIRAGDVSAVKFDGSRATSVPMPRDDGKPLPITR